MPLPLELVEEIVDFSRDDPSSLLQLSLVSRHWVFRSQSHLFSTLTIPLPRLKDGSTLLSATRWLQLHRTLSAKTHLLLQIRTLNLIGTTWPTTNTARTMFQQALLKVSQGVVATGVLENFSFALPNASSMNGYIVAWDGIDTSIRNTLQDMLKMGSLRSITLFNGHNLCASPVEILLAAPRLQFVSFPFHTTRIHEVFSCQKIHFDDTLSYVAAKGSWTHLEIDRALGYQLLNQALNSTEYRTRVSGLYSLTIKLNYNDWGSLALKAIQHSSQTLRTLVVNWPVDIGAGSIGSLNLHYLARLVHIAFLLDPGQGHWFSRQLDGFVVLYEANYLHGICSSLL